MKKTLMFAVCFVIGVFIIIQSRTAGDERLYVSSQMLEEYKTAIQAAEAETENANNLREEIQEKINYYAAVLNGQDASIADELEKEVQYYKKISGNTDVEGPGISLKIDDGTRQLYEGEDENNLLIHDSDLLMIINELNIAGAEAISLNGHRITANTEIACSGYTVNVGGTLYARPFIIYAIGNSLRLERAIMGPNGYGRLLKDYYELNVEVKRQKKLFIERCYDD